MTAGFSLATPVFRMVTALLLVMQREVMHHLLDRAGIEADEGHDGVVTLIQRFGSAANLLCDECERRVIQQSFVVRSAEL